MPPEEVFGHEEVLTGEVFPTPPEEVLSCQRKLGELCWLTTVFRPDICASSAALAAEVTNFRACDAYRINDPIRTVANSQEQVVFEYSSKVDANRVCTVGWSDACVAGQGADGECRPGFMFGFLPMSLKDPCHLAHWIYRFTRRPVRSNFGAEIYAFSEVVGRMEIVMRFFTIFGRG